MKHIITIDDLSLADIEQLIDDALEFLPYAKKRKQAPQNHRLHIEFDGVKGLIVIMMLEPSSRTAYSNDVAGRLNNFEVMMLAGQEALSLAKKETLADAFRTHAGTQLAHIFVVRTPFEGSAKFATEILTKSGYDCAVHNAGDGANRHPTQALLNLASIKHRLGRLHDFTIGFFGDLRHSRTLNSDIDCLRKLNAEHGDIRIITVNAPGTGIPEYRKQGLQIEEADDFSAFSACDVIMGTRIQEERYVDPMELARVQGRYALNRRIVDSILKKGAIIMHPGPRGLEIAEDISTIAQNAMWEQMTIGVALRMAAHRWSFLRLDEETAFDQITPCRIDTLDEEPNEKRLEKRRQSGKVDDYFQPIRNCGTIIDHIPSGLGKAVAEAISTANCVNGSGAFHVVSIEGRKDIVVLHGMLLKIPGKTLAEFLAPGMRANEVVDGTFRKQSARISGATMPYALKCPNKMCISHHPEADSSFTVCLNTSRAICSYCRREFTRAEIIRSTFGINIKTA